MAEIDLIPADYRRWLDQRRLLRDFAIVVGIVAALLVGASEWSRMETVSARDRASELRTNNAISQQQQQQLEQLRNQQAEYRRQLSLLRGLRAGAAIEDIFTIIDRSMVEGELWFVDWSFRRAGVIVNGEQRGVETGYFIIADPDAEVPGSFEVETHMSIHGQARDHQALSNFVRALFEQSQISDVSVQKTSRVDYGGGSVVDFNLTVVLASEPREI